MKIHYDIHNSESQGLEEQISELNLHEKVYVMFISGLL